MSRHLLAWYKKQLILLRIGYNQVISLEGLWQHCLQVANLAKIISSQKGVEQPVKDHAYLAGLLHDVGKVLLAVSLPEKYREALASIAWT